MQNFINGSLIVKKFPLSQYFYKKNKIILSNLHLLKYISINSATRRSTCMYNVFISHYKKIHMHHKWWWAVNKEYNGLYNQSIPALKK